MPNLKRYLNSKTQPDRQIAEVNIFWHAVWGRTTNTDLLICFFSNLAIMTFYNYKTTHNTKENAKHNPKSIIFLHATEI